ncbi:PREDICTED: DNA topoisomerase 3-alpha [Thamnophis sirtalis]|uniref:DNA topoisomerase n=1 Tax=Thamnophis sirtalis TaxID=35019 RepID=A0A6I9YT39_9SAUR|nr:PREDICTED: DNA topoisomerase 3-alpha [Thamnophis sirtalis]
MLGQARGFAWRTVMFFSCSSSLGFRPTAKTMELRNLQKVLCVAEKNDAARGIADILSNSRMRRREGMSKYNKIYEFQYHLFNQNVTLIMTSVSGHLLAHDFKAPFRKWHSCNPLVLFDAEIEKFCPENYMDIKRTLEREVQPCQALVIWTDCDREGENIGFEIIHVCKAVKPNLQVFRARFSEITPRAIRSACENLTQPDPNVNDAVEVRQELDLRIGAAFTRFQTLRLQKIFPEVLAQQLISYGSCQFPTLGFVVERFKAIQAFVQETFYRIKGWGSEGEAQAGKFSLGSWTFRGDREVTKSEECFGLLPLELEKLASRKLKINAKETMKIAEKLYTQGYISYPRTETNIFPKDLNLSQLVQLQTQDPHWGAFAQRILDQGGPTPRRGTKSDQAHPPIHPTKHAGNLQGNDQRLYEFIVRHFLACCSEDAKGQETTVEIEISGERFVAHGLMILARNYLEVYPYERWSDKVIPLYQEGSCFQPTTMEMVEGETSPPQLLTEADLISLMEKHGIGTDATHAEHIETIKSRMYVGLTPDQRFLPGHLGMGLVEGYDSMGYEMSKPDLRAELENDLKLICEGKKDKALVLREQIQKYKQVFVAAVAKAKKLDEALAQYFGEMAQAAQEEDIYPAMPDPVRKCPQCNSDMILKTKKNGGFYLSCLGYPACKSSVWFPDSVLEVSKDDSVCDVCQPPPVHRLRLKFKRGSLPAMMPLEFVGCVGGCDENLRQILGLKYLQGPASAPSQPRNLPAEAPGSLNGTIRSRGQRVLAPLPPPPAPAHRAPPAVASAAGNDAVMCNCGEAALLLTVRKEGPNQGRQFYKCGTGSCRFFLWAEQQEPDDRPNGAPGFLAPAPGSSLPGQRSSAGPRRTGSDPGPGAGSGGPLCRCDQPVVTRTVQKEGPNKGRQFHTCSKPREQQCGFFEWADESLFPAASTFPSSAGRWPQRGPGEKAKRPGSDSSVTAPTKRPRTCSVCHQPGHTKTKCPQNR